MSHPDKSCAPAGWMGFAEGPEVIPQNDLREHEHGQDCWCEPFLDDNVLVHNSLDQREAFEPDRKPR